MEPPLPKRSSKRSKPGFLEAGLWCVALLCFFVLGSAFLKARAAERSVAILLAAKPQQAPPAAASSPAAAAAAPAAAEGTGGGAIIGRMVVPAVGLSVPVFENYDNDTLKRGVGHVPGTALPGGLGNAGFAGHRDTFLRPVRNIRKGMEIDLVTPEGKYRYQVDTMEIVTPDQVEVLDIRTQPELTLITCYPFNFIGAAPKRFIVHAHLLSLEPS